MPSTIRFLQIAAPLAFLCLANLETATAQSSLRDLVRQVQETSSLHFQATVEAKVFDPTGADDGLAVNGEVISGQFEYWGSGQKYRQKSYMDPQRYPGMNSEIAYDGSRFQLLRKTELPNAISYSMIDNDIHGMALSNPMIELLQYLHPLTDANASKYVRFKDVVSDATAQTKSLNTTWVTVQEDRQLLDRAEFAGGTYEGVSYVYHVFTMPGVRDRPIRIDRVTPTGRVTSTEFSHYTKSEVNGRVTYWPQSIVLKSFDSQGQRQAEISYSIGVMEVDQQISTQTFAFDWAGCRVWDDDLGMFIQ